MSNFREIAFELRSGKRQSEIAAKFGVSRQRVHQIAVEVLPDVERKQFTCQRCGHHWMSRGRNLEKPNKCSKCCSRLWETIRPEPRQPQPLYQCWKNMLARCRNPNHFAFKFCGAHGIKVCARWHRFENFYKDMGKRPVGTILLRVNYKRGFEPKNCKWGTWKEQARYRRSRGSSKVD